MTIVRSAAFNVFFFGWIVLMLLLLWLLLPFKRSLMQGAVRLWARSVHGALKSVAGLDHRIRGRENIPDGAAIYACKHQSTWETIVFLLIFDDVAYVLKEELLSIPLWGWCARKCESIAVDRAGGAAALRRMVRDTRAALAKGRAVIVFPEGTRSAPGARHPYHPGIAALYARGGAPVIPVALNSGLFWGRRSFVKRRGTITVEFLPAMPGDLKARAFLAALEERIESAAERLHEEAAPGAA